MRTKYRLFGFCLVVCLLLSGNVFGLTSEEYANTQALNDFKVEYPGVEAYRTGQHITRLYGVQFGYGSNPQSAAENFIMNHSDLFGVETDDLKPVSLLADGRHIQPLMYERVSGDYKFTLIYYSQHENNMPVFRGDLRLLVRNEPGYPLVLASSALRDLGDFSVPTGLSVNEQLAINSAVSFENSLNSFSDPRLVIWAGLNDDPVAPRVAMEIVGDNGMYASGELEKWLLLVDAQNGEILYAEDMVVNVDVDGNVSGKATDNYVPDICDSELPTPMPWARVYIQNGSTAYADSMGDFTIPNSGSSPVDVYSHLRGEWFRVFNEAGAEAELDTTVTPPGPANFMHNNANSSEYNRAEVNGYLHSNIVRDFVLRFNPSYPGLQQNEFPVNVNISSTCNAYYDYSSINFFRSGGGCPNTAFGTVIHHEYGHHLVAMAGSGQGQYGEGMSDVMGVLITDLAGIGYGFFSNCNEPLRTGDNDLQYPCTGQIHYCGQLLSGSVWSIRNELIVNYPDTYMDILANLAVNAMLLHTGDMITPQIAIDFLTLDDDNGNIYDGTPHYPELCAGFADHNMDCPELALIGFEYPNGLPEFVDPDGGTTVRVEIYGITGSPQEGTGEFHYNSGSGWITEPMTIVSPNVYDAVFPAIDCGDNVDYYFSAETSTGYYVTDPNGAPDNSYSAVSATGLNIVFEDDFETNQGWSVVNDCSDGQWGRGVPIGGGDRGDPPTDYDESGQCYLTDNVDGNSDVDDGYTYLISPTLDLSDGSAIVEYALWYTNNYGADPNNDLFKVYVSNNNGGNWTLAQTFGPVTSSGWNMHSFNVSEFVTPTAEVKVRFEASDLNSGSVVEAGVDAFKVYQIECGPLPDVTVDMAPDDPPIFVPQGGSFTYTGILNNNTDSPTSTDVWVMVGTPNQGLYGPVQQANNISLAPNQTLSYPGVVQNIPNFAPIGEYEYIAYCGDYPNTILDSVSFTFWITAPRGGTNTDWSVIGGFGGESSEMIPSVSALLGNFPNPFNPVTTFNYALANDAHVNLEVYNLMGRKVSTVIDAHQSAGYRSVQWDAAEYSSGVYFYKLTIGDQVFTKRMTLLK
ncbi:MAG: T9SS type A sorting domain-containing protein [candidate division Zixibacteria bacterium]|nr:T9SS type A sorting domain-containing protein [candidate division Zixibacteria bacterium]